MTIVHSVAKTERCKVTNFNSFIHRGIPFYDTASLWFTWYKNLSYHKIIINVLTPTSFGNESTLLSFSLKRWVLTANGVISITSK